MLHIYKAINTNMHVLPGKSFQARKVLRISQSKHAPPWKDIIYRYRKSLMSSVTFTATLKFPTITNIY